MSMPLSKDLKQRHCWYCCSREWFSCHVFSPNCIISSFQRVTGRPLVILVYFKPRSMNRFLQWLSIFLEMYPSRCYLPSQLLSFVSLFIRLFSDIFEWSYISFASLNPMLRHFVVATWSSSVFSFHYVSTIRRNKMFTRLW